MITPYDWQEGIGHRAQFVEARLSSGIPVAAASISDGIVAASFRRQSRKVFEIYDRLMFAGIGQQSDVEALRVAAIDFTHQEGYQRSEEDVTIQRVVTALSQPIKKAFADFSSAPIVARSLFAQVGKGVEEDRYYLLDYDGDFSLEKGRAGIAATDDMSDTLRRNLRKLDLRKATSAQATEALRGALLDAMHPDKDEDTQILADLTFEAAILDRDPARTRRFRILAGAED